MKIVLDYGARVRYSLFMNTAMNLGDTVSGIYFGVRFEGVLISHGPNGVGVRTNITVHGIPRDGIFLENSMTDIRTLKLVKRGNATEADCATTTNAFAPGTYLRGGHKMALAG